MSRELPSIRHRRVAAPGGARVEGRVRWFDQIRGVGVATAGPGHQVHLHYRELREGAYRALDAGDRVTFWIESTPDGPVAREVELLGSLPRE